MRKRLFILVLAVLLVACGSGVSKESYNQVADRLSQAESKVSQLEKELQEYKVFKEKYEQNKALFDKADAMAELDQQIAEKTAKILELETAIGVLSTQLDAAQTEAQRKATEGTTVYEDEKVKINFKEVKKGAVIFLVENKTDINLTIQADTISINGFSYGSIVMSDDIAPQSKGFITARISELTSLEKVESVSGQLRVIDFQTWDSYEVVFVNVQI